MSLFAPVVRQILAQSQQPRRRELDRRTALKQRAHNIRGAAAWSTCVGHDRNYRLDCQ